MEREILLHGPPIDATLALLPVAGEECKTLLAVGSGAVGGARLGSVSTNVLRAARGPVLIYSRSAEESMGRTSRC